MWRTRHGGNDIDENRARLANIALPNQRSRVPVDRDQSFAWAGHSWSIGKLSSLWVVSGVFEEFPFRKDPEWTEWIGEAS